MTKTTETKEGSKGQYACSKNQGLKLSVSEAYF